MINIDISIKLNCKTNSLPDYTVGFGISPNPPYYWLVDFNHRYGISPNPVSFNISFYSVLIFDIIIPQSNFYVKN